MLEGDYSSQFRGLIDSIDWDIELPSEWANYFQDRGHIASYADDQRHNQRMKVRTHGLMAFDQSLPFCPRTRDLVGVYTRDFSCNGAGFLAPFQLFPDEVVRVLLATFWVKLRVVRARRITSKCYEIGTELVCRRDPSPDAFAKAAASC